MTAKMIQRLLSGLLLSMLVAPLSASAEELNWAEKMFEKRSHDFGVVARGSDARYRLALTNVYQPPVHIAEVRTSCGCTAAKPSRDTLASRETAYIEVTMDTRKFTHQKDSSITVVIDSPMHAEVRIPIRAYIRTDVVLSPGGVEFGSVTEGTGLERKISVAYAGRNDWTIQSVLSRNPNVSAKIVETARGAGQVRYDLIVAMKPGAPAGELREQLLLVANDQRQIPVLVEGRIQPEFTVNPGVVSFGILAPGEKKTVNVVLRGAKPFEIDKIESDHPSGAFELPQPGDSKAIQVLRLTVTAPPQAGSVDEQFAVTIKGKPHPVRFRAYGKIVAAGPKPESLASKPGTAKPSKP